ncbi:MAG: EscU/YscU/HrcU family type III secretion system export apparatus switch protein [Planctomycetota bacterium]|jgi:flagellar biosynthetic protein FlhB
MAEESAAEKTEDASARKKSQAREQGNVASSRDLNAAAIVFTAVVFLRYGGMLILEQIFSSTIFLLEGVANLPLPVKDEVSGYTIMWVSVLGRCFGPVAVMLFLVALIVGFSQVGFGLSWESVSLKFDKLNPVAGFMNMFKLKNLVMLAMNLSKVALVALVAYFSIRSELMGTASLVDLTVRQMATHIAQAVLDMAVYLATLMLVLALADFWYQRFQWERDLRMTKQEVKEEMRDTEGDPHVRSKRRGIQRQMAMQRMMSEVPKAEVVVRNPTHYAVALSYDPQGEGLPTVVAKGVDRVALRIVKTAVENGVAVRYQPVLARALYKLELGDTIPQELWQPVVEVLSWVYRGEKGASAREALLDQRSAYAKAG